MRPDLYPLPDDPEKLRPSPSCMGGYTVKDEEDWPLMAKIIAVIMFTAILGMPYYMSAYYLIKYFTSK